MHMYRWRWRWNGKGGMMNYWCHRHDLCYTRTQKSCLFHHDTYNGIIIDRQVSNISRCLMKYLTFENAPYTRHYIDGNLNHIQYPQVHSSPFQITRWDLNSSMELQIFLCEGKEFHNRTPWYHPVFLYQLWVETVISHLVNCTHFV